MSNALAILIAQKNNAQKILVSSPSKMLEVLSTMLERNIGTESTQKLLTSLGEGYVKYGRLTSKQFAVLESVILQYADEILKKPEASVIAQPEERVIGGDLDSVDDEDPFK